MPITVLETFSVPWLQVLNERGVADRKLMPALSVRDIKKLYTHMILARLFDEKCIALQKQGRMGTYASHRGQEAAQVGSAAVLKKEDWLFPSFRESAALLARGIPPEKIMAYWAGDERGDAAPPGNNTFTAAIPVASQITHAVGVAWGMKLMKKRAAALVYFGDGATSKGDFHEGLNWAGVFKAPVVFLCQNNQFAISCRVEQQTAAKTIAQKALAYGFKGVRVDGNDVFGVVRTVRKALAQARAGNGPTLIEAFTYRVEHHTTADDSWRYRTKKEVGVWVKKDPIDRLELWMKRKRLLPDTYKKKVMEEARKRVEEAVKKMESLPKPRPGEMFDSVFKVLPWNLKEQKRELLDTQEDNNEKV